MPALWLGARLGHGLPGRAAVRSGDLPGRVPYLDSNDLHKALHNLAALCRGALYLEAVTAEDWAADVVDEKLTDARQFKHPAQAYRDGLAPHFIEMGGGLWLLRGRCARICAGATRALSLAISKAHRCHNARLPFQSIAIATP